MRKLVFKNRIIYARIGAMVISLLLWKFLCERIGVGLVTGLGGGHSFEIEW